jgi:hypothetical protein
LRRRTLSPSETVFVSVSPQTPAAPTQRLRVRPYLNWLERSRDKWKSKAQAAQADANRLRRSARLLTASRDRWRDETLRLRCQLRAARLDLDAKNATRS